KDLKRAIESFRHSLAIQPDRFWAQYFLAVCLLKEHRPAEAQAALIACQSRRPGFVWAYLLKGFAEGEMREFDLALEDLRRAIALMPPDDPAAATDHLERALILQQAGRYEDSLADCDQALRLRPNRLEVHRVRGIALMMLKRYDEAARSFDACLARG